VFGAIVRELSQHLIADRGHAVGTIRRRDQLVDLALLVVGEARTPVDRRSRPAGDIWSSH
jgi:hypothetical protein